MKLFFKKKIVLILLILAAVAGLVFAGIAIYNKAIEDFEKRSKLNQTLLEVFKDLGVLDGLSNKDIEQISLFDFM